ncbi:5-formyltetrahydrofolate cyclo-ligase [Falsigemmobacter intermedius]|uniref:5-formyltetrahydrofolate cyclo-ligase n=1 Tax=Falsigemmobacter intermedius TaxID=1553448 RepID=A0A3S3UNC3_9RHOB|nr:5-formyltetrahydrofolate cyclo-ligase [Falsigemmobacter intermedius]RWY44666.1 5-formyltetrahydrofolate cyclo-ligase [Falsigemmobacter intermedius]
MSAAQFKADLRRRAADLRAEAFERENLTAANLRLSAALGDFQGQVLAGYLAMRSEADPALAMAAHSGDCCLPVVARKAAPLIFRAWKPGEALVPGAFGTHEPPQSAPELVPQVLIVPMLAFDARGYRLGYGGGFYDRTLEALRARGKVTAIGFAFDAQEADLVPVEPTDQPLDLIVTPTRLIWPMAT